MKTSFCLPFIGCMAIACSARAQGTFVFDQQSSTNQSGLSGGLYFQTMQPFGQSFVPSLSSIDFVRLFIYPGGPEVSDATVYVNLLSGSINGSVLASTSPLDLHNYFSGYTNFYFSTAVSLNPGTTYYLQPIATKGNPVTDISAGYTYPNGSLFISGLDHYPQEMWFREGIVVPEPATLALSALGLAALTIRKRAEVRK